MVGIDFGKPLFTLRRSSGRFRSSGPGYPTDYADKDLLVVGVLKGAIFFMSDLLRSLRISVQDGFHPLHQLILQRQRRDPVRMICDIKEDIRGKHVLLVEDIMDSGVTLDYLKKMLQERGPASLKVCVLLDKAERRQVQIEADYAGFRIPNKYVVGYGLDYKDRYRNLPYIAVLPVEQSGGVNRS